MLLGENKGHHFYTMQFSRKKINANKRHCISVGSLQVASFNHKSNVLFAELKKKYTNKQHKVPQTDTAKQRMGTNPVHNMGNRKGNIILSRLETPDRT